MVTTDSLFSTLKHVYPFLLVDIRERLSYVTTNVSHQASFFSRFLTGNDVHGGIALTSPPCHKKTDQFSNKKSPVYDQTDRRNTRRKKRHSKKTLTVHAELYARGQS